ncbi:MAG: hypothetical protein JKY18_03615 [Flavobacteriales bacterium]|nr:hypothetical protein [Flavobacteriales bacterium]
MVRGLYHARSTGEGNGTLIMNNFAVMKDLLPFLLIVILASSCKKEELEDKFQYSDTEFTYSQKIIMKVPVPLVLGFDIPFIPLSITETGSGTVTDPLVKSVRDVQLKNMSITITSPVSKTWYFLKDLEVFISYGSLPEVKLAHHYNCINDIGSTLNMMPERGVVLDGYVENGSFDLRMEISTDNLPTSIDTLTLEADMNFNVKLTNTPK